MGGYAWVTLATNDPYCLGALVLAHSLKRVETKHDLVILITPGITCTMREKLNAVFSLVEEVNVLNSQDEANLALLARPELGITFTKLHCWKLTQYEKCVFVDADALVIRNCDELFEREELSAAPDVGWPDCFNSGVFVFKPSQTTFESLTSFAASKGSFDGGDQGLLNQYFNDWAHKDITKHLPFIYNMCSTATYSYLPAYKQFGKDVKIIHFIGSTKPWLQYFDSQTRQVHPSSESGHLETLLQHWWNIFCEMVHPQLSPQMTGIAGALAKMTLGTARTPEQEAFEQHMRKQSWEQGKIDYMGRDSFDNIWTKICTTITTVNERESTIPYEKVDQSITAAQSANMKTQAPTTEAEVPTLQHPHEAIKYVRPHENIKEETIALNAACCENPTFPPEMSDRYIPPELMSATNAITQNSDGIMQECPKSFSTSKCSSLEFCSHESSGQYENMRTVVVDAAPQAKGDKCIRIPTVIPLPFSPEIELGSMMSTANQMNETRLKESFAIRELQTTRDDVISSVPMQVAESVLEADIKESVSEDVRPVTEEAISSISAPIRESISAVMETPLEPRAPAHSQSAVALLPLKANGTAVSTEFSQSSELIVPLISSAVSQQELLIKTAPTCVPTTSSSSSSSSSSDSVLKGVRKSGTQMKESERIVSTIGTTSEDESPSYDQQNVSQTTPYEASSTQDITHIFQISEPTTVIAPTAETTIIPNVQSKTNVLDNVSLEAEPLMAKYDENQHEKPLVIIKSGIPGTPIITEATPPTSPLLDATASSEQINKITEKIVNKAIPKSSAEGKIERNETEESKKLTKRINKKASSCLSKKSKEPREMLEDSTCSSAVGKPKKIIKVKKITKSVHSLETTTCVPDTPPPTTSDTPIPPKRKVKSVISKPPTNKPDAEL